MYLTRAGQPLHISSASADYPSNGGTIGALLGLFGLMATACWLFTRDVLLSIDDALSGSSAASPLRQLRTKSLSLREIEVVQLVAEGKSNDAIARELFVSPRTVHTHVANALRKSGCTNRTELGVLAIREGLAPLSASESDEVS